MPVIDPNFTVASAPAESPAKSRLLRRVAVGTGRMAGRVAGALTNSTTPPGRVTAWGLAGLNDFLTVAQIPQIVASPAIRHGAAVTGVVSCGIGYVVGGAKLLKAYRHRDVVPMHSTLIDGLTDMSLEAMPVVAALGAPVGATIAAALLTGIKLATHAGWLSGKQSLPPTS